MTRTRSLILFDHEIRAALRGELRLVVRPVMPQPGLVFWNTIVVAGYGGWTDEHGLPTPCPLGVPGTRLVGREKWALDEGWPYYSADFGADGYNDKREWARYFRWRSPATMPAWASRIALVNETVSVCRLGDMTAQDARDAGFQGDNDVMALGAMLADWQTRYQPKGMGIEARPWCWKVAVKGVEK